MALKKETLAKEFAAHLAKAMRDNNCLAMRLPGRSYNPVFFEWEAGGEIRKVTPIDVTGQAACID